MSDFDTFDDWRKEILGHLDKPYNKRIKTMAWIGSFMDCWLRMQAHTPLRGSANLAIIKRQDSAHYELHYKDDLSHWAETHLDRKFRVVVCPSSHEMRCLIKSAQFNLFEGKEDASPETAPQAGE